MLNLCFFLSPTGLPSSITSASIWQHHTQQKTSTWNNNHATHHLTTATHCLATATHCLAKVFKPYLYDNVAQTQVTFCETKCETGLYSVAIYYMYLANLVTVILHTLYFIL